MNNFKFKYTPTVWAMLFLVLVLSVVGVGWNVFNLVSYLWAGTFKIIVYVLLIVMTSALALLVLSLIIYGKYVVKNDNLYTCFGFFKNKTPVSEIVQITHFKKSNKLVVYFLDAKYTVIIISPEKYEQFVLAIRQINRNVIFDARIDGEDTP